MANEQYIKGDWAIIRYELLKKWPGLSEQDLRRVVGRDFELKERIARAAGVSLELVENAIKEASAIDPAKLSEEDLEGIAEANKSDDQVDDGPGEGESAHGPDDGGGSRVRASHTPTKAEIKAEKAEIKAEKAEARAAKKAEDEE